MFQLSYDNFIVFFSVKYKQLNRRFHCNIVTVIEIFAENGLQTDIGRMSASSAEFLEK